jgi:hypothetical protein
MWEELVAQSCLIKQWIMINKSLASGGPRILRVCIQKKLIGNFFYEFYFTNMREAEFNVPTFPCPFDNWQHHVMEPDPLTCQS